MSRNSVVTAVVLSAGLLCAQTPPRDPTTEVVGAGNFSYVVQDLDRFIHFYRDILGLELAPPGVLPFDADPALPPSSAATQPQRRRAVLKIPGSSWRLEGIEYRNVDRTPVRPDFQDPGAVTFVTTVRNIDVLVSRLRMAG